MRDLLSSRASGATSSAIRDLLDQARRPGMISLAGGLPAADCFPIDHLAQIAHDVLAADGQRILQYGVTRGEADARTALATLYDDAVDPDDLVVTTGSQQGLDLLCRVLLDPGDIVITGTAEYLGVLQVLDFAGATAYPVPIDEHGLDTDRLAQVLATGLRPKACYVVPHFHNPTGATISSSRRVALHQLSAQYGFVVIEDDPYRQLFYDGDLPTEAEADPDLTVRLRSTSKVLTPGLRIGVLAGPAWLTEAVVTAKQSADLHTSTLTQAVVAAALGADWFDAHVAQLRELYAVKRDVLVDELRNAFGASATFAPPRGGMFVWVNLGCDTSGWLARSLDAGVCFVPGAAFSVDADLGAYARLSFVTASADDLRRGVARLAGSAPSDPVE